jgi:hypothetical protein
LEGLKFGDQHFHPFCGMLSGLVSDGEPKVNGIPPHLLKTLLTLNADARRFTGNVSFSVVSNRKVGPPSSLAKSANGTRSDCEDERHDHGANCPYRGEDSKRVLGPLERVGPIGVTPRAFSVTRCTLSSGGGRNPTR